MEYVYSAMLLHSAGKKITADNLKKVLTAAGVKADESRIQALTASLEGVNIDEAIQKAAVSVPTAVSATPASSEETPKPAEEKSEEKKKKKEEPEVTEEEAAAGLGALFG
jgi:large subunit ribosomal protein L12